MVKSISAHLRIGPAERIGAGGEYISKDERFCGGTGFRISDIDLSRFFTFFLIFATLTHCGDEVKRVRLLAFGAGEYALLK